MDNLIRSDKLAGNIKTFVGNPKLDLVLETLGKVYIKTGKNLRLLTEIFKYIDKYNKLDTNTIASSVIISTNMSLMKYPGDGKFIFNPNNESLYLSYDLRYILILDNIAIDNQNTASEESSEYVKKSGDTMTGSLTIHTKGAPLIVASKELVSNFNAEYLNGHIYDEFAIKALDEYISGSWTFNKTVTANADVVINSTIGTSTFIGGYQGVGWQLNSATNSLTVDYLIVRKAMHVYELIVNKITATNGSLWVTDTCKVEEVSNVIYISDLSSIPKYNSSWYLLNRTYISIDKNNIADANDRAPLSGTLGFYNYGLVTRKIDNNTETIYFFDNSNSVYAESSTPFFYSIGNISETCTEDEIKHIKKIYVYYKYFGLRSDDTSDIYVLQVSDNTLLLGDIIRCQKFIDNNIKYYDALVCGISDNYVLIIKAANVFDCYTDELGNIKTNSELTEPAKGDALVRIGNILKSERLGSMYLSSSDFDSPVLKVLDGVNRPDYSVIYRMPKFDKMIVDGKKWYYSTTTNNDHDEIVEIELKDKTKITYYLYNFPQPNCEIEYDIKKIDDNPIKQYHTIINSPLKTIVGKLDGIKDDLLKDRQPKGYGLYANNVYLTGEFVLNNGKSLADFSENITLLVGDINTLLTAGMLLYTEEKEDGTKVNKMALWGDDILIYTRDKDNNLKRTAFIKDGLINADLIKVDKLSFNNLVGQTYKTITRYTITGDISYTPKLGILETFTFLGITNYSITPVSMDNNYFRYEDRTLVINDFYATNANNEWFHFKRESIKEGNLINFTWSYISSEKVILCNLPEEILNIEFSEGSPSSPTIKFINMDKIGTSISTEKKIITINELQKGEILLYWDDGSVMNCKIFKMTGSGSIRGCVEFFFEKGYVSPEIVDAGYAAIIEKVGLTEGTNGLIKMFDYFMSANSNVSFLKKDFYIPDITESPNDFMQKLIKLEKETREEASLNRPIPGVGVFLGTKEKEYIKTATQLVNSKNKQVVYVGDCLTAILQYTDENGKVESYNLDKKLFKLDYTKEFTDSLLSGIKDKKYLTDKLISDGIYLSYIKKANSNTSGSYDDAECHVVLVSLGTITHKIYLVVKNGRFGKLL